jgi:fumarate reductase subunit C
LEQAVVAIDESRQGQHSFPVGRGFVSWLMQRLTGLVLAICLVVHVASTHLLRAGHIDAAFVRERLAQEPAMMAFYGIFIVALVYHACNGIWAVLLDFNASRGARRAMGVLLYLAGAALVSFGFVALHALMSL